MKKILNIGLIGFIICFGIWGCSTNDDEDQIDSVTLGVILPMDVGSGELRENAIKLARNEINGAGGVLDGLQLEIDVRSSEGVDREIAAAAQAQDLLASHDNLIGFITSFSSSSKGVVQLVANDMHVPTISGSGTSNQLSGISNYFQRLAPADKYQSEILAQKADETEINTVAIAIQGGDLYSHDLADVFKDKFVDLGHTDPDTVSFFSQDSDYENKLNLLFANDPDAVLISMNSEYVEFLTKVDSFYSKVDLDSLRFLIPDALKTNELLTDAPTELLSGDVNCYPKSIVTISSPDPASEIFQYFQTELLDNFGQEVSSYNAQFYDIVYLFALAIEKASLTQSLNNLEAFREEVNLKIRVVSNPEALFISPDQGWESMRSNVLSGFVDYEGASGNCNIDENGDVVTPYEVFKIIQNPDTTFSFETIEYVNP